VRARAEGPPERQQLSVEIADSGIGIEREELEHIFDAFHQGRPGTTRRFGGLGLGLAITRALVELHGGAIAADSAGRDRGSRFTVQLPIVPGLAAAAVPGEGVGTAPGEPAGGMPPPAGRPGLHILLVEDHPDTAEAMADLLSAAGHEVTVAGSVAAGIAAADAAAAGAGGIDLVVSDLGLPDGSGLDLMRKLAGRHGLKGIALSGYGMEEDVRKSREAGFELHLTKPVDLAALKAAILEVAGAAVR
jgi:CheY-like chemotaxis protein